jgi:hypothetical protein
MITPEMLSEMVKQDNSDNHPIVALTILNLMKECGVDKADFTYTGSGDSPDSCDGEFYVLLGTVTTMKNEDTGEETQVEDWLVLPTGDSRYQALQPYYDSMSEFVFQLSYQHWGGWYNNEGGYGNGIFYAHGDNPRMTIDHYDYVQSEEFQGEHEYAAGGSSE